MFRHAPEIAGHDWIGTDHPLSLEDLRGKVVLLDFWTLCCINCLHVLDELRPLETKFADELVIIGVHSPKFSHEAELAAVTAATQRYGLHHPVVNDPDMRIWQAYGARAWPTLVLIDPGGQIVSQMAGEGHGPALDRLVTKLVAQAEQDGSLRRAPGPWTAPPTQPSVLRFPSKALALPGTSDYLVADAGHHVISQVDSTGGLTRRIGSGEPGLVDGPPDQARFSEPSGICLVPAEVAAEVGYDLLVADTVNHALRAVRLADGQVTTVAGTGQPAGPADLVASREQALSVRLSSPWDLVWDPGRQLIVVAMAGVHQLWAFDPVSGEIGVLVGTGHEGLVDGRPEQAWLAQPSGVAMAADGRLWFADSEVSALRYLDPPIGETLAQVHTAIGQGLFDFGHVDGVGDQALLQHPLGLTVLPDRRIAVADTYNGAVRIYDPDSAVVSTLTQGLDEPSDVLVVSSAATATSALATKTTFGPKKSIEPGANDWGLMVVESGAHRLVELPQPDQVSAVDGGRRQVQRPPLELSAGPVQLTVPFEPAPGQKLDERYGPSTQLTVSATPSEIILKGAGQGTELNRELIFKVGQGVLHVTARAAACDTDSAHSACHLVTQDWGITVQVKPSAPPFASQEISLPLRA